MSSGMTTLNQTIGAMQNYAKWIQLALLCISKLKMFIKTLQMMLKKDLIHQIMKSIHHCLKEKIKSDSINER